MIGQNGKWKGKNNSKVVHYVSEVFASKCVKSFRKPFFARMCAEWEDAKQPKSVTIHQGPMASVLCVATLSVSHSCKPTFQGGVQINNFT